MKDGTFVILAGKPKVGWVSLSLTLFIEQNSGVCALIKNQLILFD